MSTYEKRAHEIVDAEGHPVHAEPRESGFDFASALPPVSLVVDVARMGVQLGIGLVALALDAAQKVADEAIDRGAKLEKQGLEAAREFEREQVASMKAYLARAKSRAASDVAIEAHVEEALKTHDVPTRDDIRDLNGRIAALDAKLSTLVAK
jgi:polyhydroxyalkanoate synthesis regulator phasin